MSGSVSSTDLYAMASGLLFRSALISSSALFRRFPKCYSCGAETGGSMSFSVGESCSELVWLSAFQACCVQRRLSYEVWSLQGQSYYLQSCLANSLFRKAFSRTDRQKCGRTPVFRVSVLRCCCCLFFCSVFLRSGGACFVGACLSCCRSSLVFPLLLLCLLLVACVFASGL